MSFYPTEQQIANNLLVQGGKNVLIKAGAGTGKAQPLYELVVTPTGYKRMEELEIGNLVATDNGEFVPIKRIFGHKSLAMYKITFSDGSQVDCCEEHLWEIEFIKKEKKTGTTTITPLADFIHLIATNEGRKTEVSCHVKLPKPVKFPEANLEIDPYLLGNILGKPDFSLKYIDIYNKFGLFQSVTNDLFIPNSYLIASVHQRIELLSGILDATANQKYKICGVTTKSAMLAKDIVWLVRSLGGTASLYPYYRENLFDIQIRTPFNPFKLKEKSTEYDSLNLPNITNKQIIDIIYIGRMPGRCIEIDSDKHLYLTSDFTVTHNSSSIRYFAQQNPNKNFLVFCFNKATAAEGQSHPEKPSNAYYMTGHSLAFTKIVTGALKKSFNNNGLSITDISDKDIISAAPSIQNFPRKEERSIIFSVKKAIITAITDYCHSASTDIFSFCKEYYSSIFSESTFNVIDGSSVFLEEAEFDSLSLFTKAHWFKIIDDNSPVQFGHDQYLKLFHLKKIEISSFYDKQSQRTVYADIVCLDEAQDTNPVMLEIFKTFKGQKIVIGDAYQSIYKFRGATDAIPEFQKQNYSVGYLTTSFRFNQEVANIANKVLKSLNSDYVLTGINQQTEIKTTAYLSRTNAAMFLKIMDYAETNFTEKVNVSVPLGDLSSKLYHICDVLAGRSPHYPNKTLRFVETKDDLLEATQISHEIANLVNLYIVMCKRYGSIAIGLDKIKSVIVKNASETSPIYFSTIHRSKGLEWDEVFIDKDFIFFRKDSEGNVLEEEIFSKLNELREDIEKQCLLYVAITRAKVKIHLPDYINDFLDEKTESYYDYF